MSLSLSYKEVLLLCSPIVIIIILFLFWRRQGDKRNLWAISWSVISTRWFSFSEPSLETQDLDSKLSSQPRHVIFNYNGHDWDAYEVLGVSAGSSLEQAEASYRESVQSLDEGSQIFLKTALEAIKKSKS